MSVEMKLGRWESRGAGVQEVVPIPGSTTEWRWESRIGPGRRWRDDGTFSCLPKDHDLDLIRYLGPLELSPTPASAEAVPAVSLNVSTETPQESLRRMRAQWEALCRESLAYKEIFMAVERAKSDLDEAIKRLEKEVEG